MATCSQVAGQRLCMMPRSVTVRAGEMLREESMVCSASLLSLSLFRWPTFVCVQYSNPFRFLLMLLPSCVSLLCSVLKSVHNGCNCTYGHFDSFASEWEHNTWSAFMLPVRLD